MTLQWQYRQSSGTTQTQSTIKKIAGLTLSVGCHRTHDRFLKISQYDLQGFTVIAPPRIGGSHLNREFEDFGLWSLASTNDLQLQSKV